MKDVGSVLSAQSRKLSEIASKLSDEQIAAMAESINGSTLQRLQNELQRVVDAVELLADIQDGR